MGRAIGASLPLAVGVALSPLPVVAVVLMLTAPRARINGPAFVLGWLAGLGIVGTIALALAGTDDPSDSGSPAAWVSWVKVGLGVVLLVLAVRRFRGRPRGDEAPRMPAWMGAIDKTTPLGAAGMAAVLSGGNPKNLLLAVAAAAAITGAGVPVAQQVVAYATFAVIATLGVGIPVGIYVLMGERSERLLSGLKDWMSTNNAVIMSVLCLVLGAKLIGDGIGGLSG